jgi:hypothetical protein
MTSSRSKGGNRPASIEMSIAWTAEPSGVRSLTVRRAGAMASRGSHTPAKNIMG